MTWPWNWGRGRSRSLKMTSFDRLYTTFYWSAIVSIAVWTMVYHFKVIWRWIMVTLKRSLKVSQTSTIRKLGCGFLFAFHSNYGRIFNRLWDILVRAFVTSGVAYCNTVLVGLPKIVIDRLQCAINAAVHVVSQTRKFDRGLTRLLHTELHWLDVPERVQYKLGVTVHRCMQRYLSHHTWSTVARCLPTSPVHLTNVFAPPAAVTSTCHDITGAGLVVGPSPSQAPSSGSFHQLTSVTRPWVLTPSTRLWKLISSRVLVTLAH